MGKKNKVSSLKFLKRKSRVSILADKSADRKSSTSSLGELQMALFFPDQQEKLKMIPIPTPPPSPPKGKLNEADKLTESTSSLSPLSVQRLETPGGMSTLDRGVRLSATEQELAAGQQSPPLSAKSTPSPSTSK